VSALSARGLKVHFGERLALQVPRLDFPHTGLVGLIGANGAGKTTLLRALAGLIRMQGSVRFEDCDLRTMPPRGRAQKVAYLPQNAEAQWPLSVRQLVALGRLPHQRALGTAGDADREAIHWAMTAVDVEQLANRPITALSGGERSRALLARSLAVQAPLLLVDEPTASLDPYHQLLIMEVLAHYAQHRGLVIAVLHDLNLAARFCDRLVLIHGGTIAADGTAREVLSDAQLARCYQVRVVRHEQDGPVIVPVARTDARRE
jgi:iron complex transport system ATP-binding protein